ncbi:MAG: TIGR03943 family protein [Chthoniobacterales bacterium]
MLWGIFLLWLSWKGQLSIYLHPSLQPYTTASGGLLLILALFVFRDAFLRSGDHHVCCHDHSHEHGHDHHPVHEEHHHDGENPSAALLLFKTILLLLPLGMIVTGQGTAFTMTTVLNRGVVDDLRKLPSANVSEAPTPAETAPSFSSGPMPVQIIDMLYAIQMPSYREEFEGKEVELTGQVVPMTTGNPKGDRFQVIRMFITCCAADAKPVGVTVQYPKPLKVPEMSWVKIIGKPTFPMEGGRHTAVLEASAVEPCEAPSEPFVY